MLTGNLKYINELINEEEEMDKSIDYLINI